MTRAALLLALASSACSPACQREWDAFRTGEMQCSNLDAPYTAEAL